MAKIATLVFRLLAGLPIFLEVGAAHAAVMTFNNLPDEGAELDSWVENGITASASGGVIGYFDTPGMAHLDDSGTSFAFRLAFTTAGAFDAQSFDIKALDNTYYKENADGDLVYTPYDNVLVRGLRNGVEVASSAFFMGPPGTATHLLDGSFSAIDRLVIEALFPGDFASADVCDFPCAHFNIDNVTLAASAVPLPAALQLFATALAGLGLWRLREVRHRNRPTST